MTSRIVMFIAVIGCALTARHAAAQGTPPLIDPKAEAIVKKMGQTLTAAKEFSLQTTSLVDEVTPTGQKLQFSKQAVLSVRRPDKMHAIVKGDRENYTAVYDGKTVVFLDPTSNQYATAPMPATIDETLDTLALKYGLVTPLADLLFSKPEESLIGRAQAGLYVGQREINGVKCDHLAFRGESVDWQLWVSQGDKPLPLKLVINYKLLPGEPQFIAMLDKWDLAPKFSPDLFQFTPPAGAKKNDLKPLPEQPKAGNP
jgi:hypothetical protein